MGSICLEFEAGFREVYMRLYSNYLAFIWDLGFGIWDLPYALDPH